ncbi:hypothetical protein Patl1_04587 [Pistacia atlantica]|uniref:Uncharacterized protein n=1 Tax=Pistacia atlantica TaxID=434234 RepID=A0ACC1BVB0_9ROSI|nr:hypothetical protein Patl1_04587 [Pistacia atlantica]
MDPETIIEVIKWIAPPGCRYWKYHRKFNEFLSSLERERQDLSIRMETIQQRLNGELRYHKVTNKEVESWGKLVDEKIQEVKRVYDQGAFPAGLVIDAPDDIGLPLPTSEMVGVCGMGGVGKTTVMKHIHNQLLKERNKFDKVIWATVSKEYAVVKLQQDIATALREDLSKHNDITMRAAVLQEMLKGRKRYVLILDDVWKQISLEEVGIPKPTVMEWMQIGFNNPFHRGVGSELLDIPTLQSTLKQIVKQCDGLPLAIVTLASSMNGERDVRIWENALNELKARMGSVEDMIDKSREAMYNKGHANLKRLEENCLLESADHGNCVKMHDLVRDMALYVTSQSPRYLVKAGMQLRELPTEHEWIEDLQKIDDSVFTHMTELKVLDLSRCYSIRNLPNSISGLVKLTALLLNGCGYLEHVPSLEKLGALKKLDLGWTGITAIPDGLEMLVHLRYLDLYAYRIKEMPGGILPKLFRLQYLRLDYAVAEAEEVSRLSKLESLGLGDYFPGGRRGKAVGIGGLANFEDSIKIPTDIRRLVIAGCDDLGRVSDISSLKDATDWRTCWIYSCKQMECFYYLSSYTTALQTLEYLFLEYLDNLIAILVEEIDGAKSTLPTPITPGIFSS